MRSILCLATLLLSPLATAAEYYKWVDQNGVVQYTTTPPKDQDAQVVKADARVPKPATTAASDESGTASDVPEQSKEEKEAAAAAEADRVACEAARTNKQILSANSVVTRLDPTTKQQVALSAEEIAAETVAAEQIIQERCRSEGEGG